MARDPVCGMQINAPQAVGQSDYQGQSYSDCSSSCKQLCDPHPQRYASQDSAEH